MAQLAHEAVAQLGALVDQNYEPSQVALMIEWVRAFIERHPA